ncbi:MAG: GDP-mannose 4,6-dehydratase [Nitrospira sp.]|nr:GDP-mannose 4,6-dehydratase [Nitrospira sp.]MCA9479705.1 GDP-mannose 4,6-dehydratase [Nitrospira sp.]MCB9710598.1 GDP-mannose 4,6-dehydratase [Nitrospiraceae bacterium]MDR4486931.1 GDP-mannose 4,6-dehydratase [Nitrospirales bacterium]
MKFCITGGAGFIGSHLAESLLEEGGEVFVIDDLSTGNIENIEHLKSHPRFHWVVDTIMNRDVMADLIDGVDTVFHLAAAVGVQLIVESPVRTIETNVRGTEIVLELANRKRKKVVIASTSEVYGKSIHIPFRESDDLVMGPPTKGRWSYACSKALDEFLALSYWKEKHCPTIIVRLFNTVGPRQTGQYGMVIPRMVGQALSHEPITVFGSGAQRRCFVWVKDVVNALVALEKHPEAVGNIYNIGNSREIRIADLAKLIKRISGSTSEIQFIPYDEAYESGFEDMDRRVPDLGKIHDLIGYSPTLEVEDIVMRVIDHVKRQAIPLAS